MWISLGDTQREVKDQQSIMRSPVVFGVKKSVAQRLGWIGRDVRVQDILDVAESGKLTFMMTSATQSNSGSSAYLGYLYAFAGNPDILTSEDLQNPEVQDKVKRILGQVDRSSGSSGSLKTLFLDQYNDYDAMVNYEAIIIETNQELVKTGCESLSSSPVQRSLDRGLPSVVNKGDPDSEKLFLSLQQYMLSQDVQQQILEKGRRVGTVRLNPTNVDTSVFNPDRASTSLA